VRLKSSCPTTQNRFSKIRQPKLAQNGQIIVEYILLLSISVGIAVLMTSTLVSRNPDDPGFLIVKWMQIIETIGKDVVDE
jgi:hypothetical protein